MQILVVEDELLIALFVCDVLAEAGHDVIGPGRTAAEGLTLAQSIKPDLALLNIDLGGETKGSHLARVLFESFGTPVLFLSGNKAEAWATKDAALGYITKPCDPSSLLKSVELVGALAQGIAPEERDIPQGLTLFTRPRHADGLGSAIIDPAQANACRLPQ